MDVTKQLQALADAASKVQEAIKLLEEVWEEEENAPANIRFEMEQLKTSVFGDESRRGIIEILTAKIGSAMSREQRDLQ